MTEVGSFWFVPANIRTYSALVADMAPADEAPSIDGLRVVPRSRREFWNALASRDPRWLRRRGWPISIAGRTSDAFPGGTVAYDQNSDRTVLTVDPALSSPIFLRELATHFGFEIETAIVQQTERTMTDHIAPPKPWY